MKMCTSRSCTGKTATPEQAIKQLGLEGVINTKDEDMINHQMIELLGETSVVTQDHYFAYLEKIGATNTHRDNIRLIMGDISYYIKTKAESFYEKLRTICIKY
jgi:hypothetical protein